MGIYEDRVKRLHDHVVAQEKKAAKEKKKAEEPNVTEIKALLTEKGIEFDEKAKKEDLLKLIEDAKQ
jgi:mannitol-1-phosphate/altronate dehydrogenase